MVAWAAETMMKRQVLLLQNLPTGAANANIQIVVPAIKGKRQRVIACQATFTAVGVDTPFCGFAFGEAGETNDLITMLHNQVLTATFAVKYSAFIGATNAAITGGVTGTNRNMHLLSRWFDKSFILTTALQNSSASTVGGLLAWLELADEDDTSW